MRLTVACIVNSPHFPATIKLNTRTQVKRFGASRISAESSIPLCNALNRSNHPLNNPMHNNSSNISNHHKFKNKRSNRVTTSTRALNSLAAMMNTVEAAKVV